MIHITQLMASPFYGGPERQIVGLARHLPADCETTFLTFAEDGRSQALLDEVRRLGFRGETLAHNFPRVGRCVAEIADRLRELKTDIVCCNGYKPDILGWRAARRVNLPVVIVSHGWTAATWKVRVYEAVDRWVHRRVEAVVSVSASQSGKVRAAGVAADKNITIVNAVGDEAFADAESVYRENLLGLFAHRPRVVIGAAGRLSPEKGFGQLVEAASALPAEHKDVGIVIFGDGPLRGELTRRIAELGLSDRVVLAGFRGDVGKFLPHLDLAAIPSYTEGLPVILLELLAAAVPIVATRVGGIPEVIDDGVTGRLVAAGRPDELARSLGAMLADVDSRRRMAEAGREVVKTRFTCRNQAAEYYALFQRLASA